MTDKSHLLRFGYAPGNYWFVCRDCGNKHAVGDKRTIRCETCAESLHAQITSVEAVADKHRAMTALPEEAKEAAARALCRHGTSFPTIEQTAEYVDQKWPRFKEEATVALTAALPFLSVQVAVKKLEWTKGVVDIAQPMPGMKYVACSTTPKGSWAWWLDNAPETRGVFTSEAAAKSAAQADYEARILSALEPSAAREQALEEGYRQGIEAAAQKAAEMLVFADTTSTADREIPAAIRALSSPDHADAGKVEGDGWRPIESAPKDGTVVDLWSAEFGRQPDCYWGKRSHCCGEDGQYCDSDWHNEPEAWIDSAQNTETFDDVTHWRPLPSAPSEGAE